MLLVLPATELLERARRPVQNGRSLMASSEALAALFLGVHRFGKPLTLFLAPSPLLLLFGLLAATVIWVALLANPAGEQR